MRTVPNTDAYDIVIIDSGLNTCYTYYNKNYITSVSICLEGEEARLAPNYTDCLGHGTAVASIIAKGAPEARLLMIRAFEDQMVIDEETLIRTLEYIERHIHTRLIHLSCGITFCGEKPRLRAVCKRLLEKGTFIVGAFDNYGALSYPAAFPEVIGVDMSLRCHRPKEYLFVENSPINIRAVGVSQTLPWTDGEYKTVCGVSFSAPHVTVQIHHLLQEQPDLSLPELLEKLKSQSMKVISGKAAALPQKLFPIQRAVVAPFNKEIHSLLRFRNKLPFALDGFYDAPYLAAKNAAYFQSILQEGAETDRLQSWNKIPWDGAFDTLILGHVFQISDIMGQDIQAYFLQRCIEHHKNIMTFDSLAPYESYVRALEQNGCRAYCPGVNAGLVADNWYGKLEEIAVPTVGIFGTSKRQGKFTLQLQLRYWFEEQGYRVGQLGTEPSSELYGMDFAYPMGYNSTVTIKGHDAIATIRRLLQEIEEHSPDIILVGAQSQTIPITYGNCSALPVNNYELLLGSSPDAFVLVVNAKDDPTYIRKTIHFLESCSRGKVIALAVSPIVQVDRWSVVGNQFLKADETEMQNTLMVLQETLKLPVFPMNGDVQKLAECVVTFFSDGGAD